jgi:hypothetical protein
MQVQLNPCTIGELRQGLNPVVGADPTKCQRYLVKNHGSIVGIRSYAYLGKFLARLGYVGNERNYQVFTHDQFQIWELGQNKEDYSFHILGTFSTWGQLDEAIKEHQKKGCSGLWWKRFECDQDNEDFKFAN